MLIDRSSRNKMASSRRTTYLTLLFASFIKFNLVLSFNIDINSRLDYQNGTDDYFGYSLTYYKTRLYVGAPLSSVTGEGQGAVFFCPSNKPNCELVTYVDTDNQGNENKTGQWKGATVYSDNVDIMACSPRYVRLGIQGANETRQKNLQGICYIFNINEKTKEWRPCEEGYNAQRQIIEFKTCQAGFSAKFFSGSSHSIVGGIPNIQLSRGRVTLGNKANSQPTLTSGEGIEYVGYMGYSVAAGVLDKTSKLQYVTGGSPRSFGLKGRVIVYKEEASLTIHQFLDDPSKPSQTGSYFGAAMASADLNGDELTDLVVGAPYFTDDILNEGLAYVYLNKEEKGEKFVLVQTLRQPRGNDVAANGMFGYAIGSVGDLNQDRLKDIAIGAPWGGENRKGIVYVYYGQNNAKEPLKLMQIIRPEDLGLNLEGFGFSFAEYYPYGNDPTEVYNDPDDNNYPDLAVGAYKSGHAIVFKSRPVRASIGSLEFRMGQKLDLDDNASVCDIAGMKYKCLRNVTACFQFADARGGMLNYTLEADSARTEQKRAFFSLNGTQLANITLNMNIKNGKKCQDFILYVKNTTDDIFQNLIIKLSWEYQPRDNCSARCLDDPTQFCPVVCPIGDKLKSSVTAKEVIFMKGCSDDGNETCSSNLTINETIKFVPDLKSTVMPAGATDTIIMTIKIENKGETAFHNYLYLEYPGKDRLNLISIDDVKIVTDRSEESTIWDPDVTREGDKTTLKVDIALAIKKGKSELVQIIMSPNTIPKGTECIKFRAFVETESIEVDPSDNSKEINIEVDLVSTLLASSKSDPEVILWKKGTSSNSFVGRRIRYSILFQSKGPSNVDTSKAVIQIPEKYKNNYLLNVYRIDVKGSSKENVGQCSPGGRLNPLGLRELVNGNATTRKRRDLAVIPLTCGDASTTCREIVCNFTRLQRSDKVTVTVEATLVDFTFENVIKGSRVITVKSNFTTDAVRVPEGASPALTQAMTTVNSPDFEHTEDTSVAWWLIVVAILAAVIIIAIIIFVLYKRGFFKRNKIVKNSNGLPQEQAYENKVGDLEEEEEE